MQQHGFTDLNVDIESVPESSPAAQLQFISFLTELRKGLKNNNINSMSIEVMASDIVRHRLISVPALKDLVDYVIVMAYDFHSTSSKVTGPVSPLSGGGDTYEYDVVNAFIKLMSNHGAVGKVINIGNNKPTSINNLADTIITLTKSSSPKKYISLKKMNPEFQDMPHRKPNIALAKQLIRFSPNTDLNQLLTEIIESYSFQKA